jgi:RimJ/RimL family protein N-acetyltransferase
MTVLLDGRVSGNILSFTQLGHPEVCYWLGKEFWGRGVATKALVGFLALLTARPLYARAARDNVASLRVLEKCGFMLTGYETAFANARGKEIEEALFRLD